MEFENKKVFPENVGKRIIEALKTGEEQEDTSERTSFAEENYHRNPSSRKREECGCSPASRYSEPESFEYSEDYDSGESALSNIDVLIDLVTKLPPGVTKQTGAGIIRHTMEAAGVSMDKLLANAQRTREELDIEVQNNINLIEEYRAKIKHLDSEICHCRKKGQELENIINLFILADNKK